jgi:hypothetical protein
MEQMLATGLVSKTVRYFSYIANRRGFDSMRGTPGVPGVSEVTYTRDQYCTVSYCLH